MGNNVMENQLSLIISLLETLPKRIFDEGNERNEKINDHRFSDVQKEIEGKMEILRKLGELRKQFEKG